MDEDYYEIDGTMRVPKGGHLSSAHGGAHYGGVLSDENNQLMGQALFIPNDDDDDEYEDEYEYDFEDEEEEGIVSSQALAGLAIGAAVTGLGFLAVRKIRKHIQAKRLEASSEHNEQGQDLAVTESVCVPAVSDVELNDEQKQEMALLFLDLADAQRRLNNLMAQGLDVSEVRAHIARMQSKLAECDPKELTDQVNRVIERQHQESQNVALLLGRQPTADTAFQRVMWQDVERALNTDVVPEPVERDDRPRWMRTFFG